MKHSKETIRVVSHDPGICNYAVSVMDITFIDNAKVITSKGTVRKNLLEIKIIKSGMLTSPMNDVNLDVVSQNRTYCAEIQRILNKYQPDIVCAERFQNRGFRAGGVQIEAVNLMLGALASLPQFDTRELKLVSPMVWKSALKKRHDLKGEYKKCRFPVHELDAALIGIYGAHILTKRKPFVDYELDMNDLHAQIILSTKSPVKKLKEKKNA